jgi:pyruvate formate lyase activating enzyme
MGEERDATGLILTVQRLSTEDGPGIRSTVFYKKCPLSCRWCHNPESISGAPELQWYATRCMGCRSCEKACPRGCIAFADRTGVRIARDRCEGCGTCAAECPTNALELLGRKVSPEGLTAELVRDRAFFDSSGGGVTLSGGEPMAQPGFTAALLRCLKAAGVSTALDTCGFAAGEALERVLPDVDLVLYDLKAIDAGLHRALTGQDNELILRNARLVAAARRSGPGRPRLWIRTPLVPGATAAGANLRAIGSFIAECLEDAVERWELCAFNNLCRAQYERLGKVWEYAATPLMSRRELDDLAGEARAAVGDPRLVSVTGAAHVETGKEPQ